MYQKLKVKMLKKYNTDSVAFNAIDDMDVLRDGLLKLAADKVHAVANGTA